jgi:hypothetical protein
MDAKKEKESKESELTKVKNTISEKKVMLKSAETAAAKAKTSKDNADKWVNAWEYAETKLMEAKTATSVKTIVTDQNQVIAIEVVIEAINDANSLDPRPNTDTPDKIKSLHNSPWRVDIRMQSNLLDAQKDVAQDMTKFLYRFTNNSGTGSELNLFPSAFYSVKEKGFNKLAFAFTVRNVLSVSVKPPCLGGLVTAISFGSAVDTRVLWRVGQQEAVVKTSTAFRWDPTLNLNTYMNNYAVKLKKDLSPAWLKEGWNLERDGQFNASHEEQFKAAVLAKYKLDNRLFKFQTFISKYIETLGVEIGIGSHRSVRLNLRDIGTSTTQHATLLGYELATGLVDKWKVAENPYNKYRKRVTIP